MHLLNCPTCLSEELAGMSEFLENMPQRNREMRGMLLEYPALRKFLVVVQSRTNSASVKALWLRIWMAIQKDKRYGTCDTLEALGEIPDFEQSDINFPPDNEQKIIGFYIRELDRLLREAASA
jgi:hypothetical protein